MADPASLNVCIQISGMDHVEAGAALMSLRPGASATFAISQPAQGGKRFWLRVDGMAIGAVEELMANIAINHDESALGIQEGSGNGD